MKKKMLELEKIKKVAKKVFTKENINSMLIAILCMSGLISFVLGINNIIPILLLLVFTVIEVVNYKETISKIKNKDIKINVCSLIFIVLIILVYLVSFITKGFRETIIERLLYFIGFLMIPFMCCRHDIKIKSIVNSILIISAILAIPLFSIKLGYFDGGTRMSISYYMLPTYIAMVMSYFVNEKRNLKYNIVKIVILLTIFNPYIMFLIQYISRGVVLAILICLLLCLIIKKDRKTKIKFIAIILGATVLLGIILLEPILYMTGSALETLGIRIEIITKNYELLQNGSFDNGRSEVFSKAIEGIKEHPIIGNGVGDYAEKYITYPHNLLLQSWYEGGIIFFVVMLFIVGYSIYILIWDEKIDLSIKYILILLLSISLVRLMLSYEFWKEISFGMYLYIVLHIMQNNWNRRKIKNGNSNNSNI